MKKALITGIGIFLTAALFAGEAVEDFYLNTGNHNGFYKTEEGLRPLDTAIDFSDPGQKTVGFEAENPHEAFDVRTRTVDGRTFINGFARVRYYVYAKAKRNVKLYACLRETNENCRMNVMGYQYENERYYRERKLDPKQEKTKNAGKWRWVQIRTFAAEPGLTPLDLSIAWGGQPELDRFMLVEGDEDPETAKAAAARTPVREFSVESMRFAHSAASRLLTAELDGAAGATITASADGGKTWGPAKNLALPSGEFRLRAVFAARPADTPVTGFRVKVGMRAEGFLKLDNGKVRVVFDVPRNGIFRITSPSLKKVFAAPEEAVAMFAIDGRDHKTSRSTAPRGEIEHGGLKKRGALWPETPLSLFAKDGKLTSATVTEMNGKPAAVFKYEFMDGKINVVASIVLADEYESKWTFEIDNRSEWDVLNDQFPIVSGLKIGPCGYDDRWANTSLYGPWVAGRQPEDRPYPGWGALGWVDLYDNSAGLSFQVRDFLEGETNFMLRSDNAQPNETCLLITQKSHCIAAGEKRAWNYAMLLHPDKWHAAADVYRREFRARFGKADHFPDWARDSNGWLMVNTALRDSSFKWPELLDSFETARQLGMNHIQVWGQFGSSSCGSFWWPSPKYGPIEEFAAMNRKIRELGGHVGYYLMFDRENRYNIIDDKTYDGYLPQDRYPKGVPIMSEEMFVKSHMVRHPAGKITAWPQDERQWKEFRTNLAKLHTENKCTTWAENNDGTFPKSSMATMNPSDKPWQDWLVMWTVGLYAEKWNCDTAYQDVLGCGTRGRSFDLRRGNHGHIFGRGNMEIAERIVSAGKKINPEYALSAEGRMDLVTRWAMGMTSNLHYGWIYVDAHRYTHPDHILVLGGCNGGYQQMLFNLGLAYIYGAKFDVILSGDVNKIKEMLAFRQSFIRYASRAEYKDELGITYSGHGIRARRFERGQDVIMVNVFNMENSEGDLTVDVSLLKDAKFGAFWLRSDGLTHKAEFARDGRNIKTRIPACLASCLMLVVAPPAGEEILCQVGTSFAPGGLRINYWIANLSPTKKTFDVGIKGAGATLEFARQEIAAYDAVSKTEIVRSDGLAASGDVELLLAGKKAGTTFLYPLIEDGSFEKTGTPVDDAPDGARVRRFGPKDGWQGIGIGNSLRPGCRYKISMMARRTGPNGDMHALAIIGRRGQGNLFFNMPFPKDVYNEWVKLETEVTTPSDMTQFQLYVYNKNSKETVDYDDVRAVLLEENIGDK